MEDWLSEVRQGRAANGVIWRMQRYEGYYQPRPAVHEGKALIQVASLLNSFFPLF